MKTTYQIVFNPATRRYRIWVYEQQKWVRNFWDLSLWGDYFFETRFKWRAQYYLRKLRKWDDERRKYESWEGLKK